MANKVRFAITNALAVTMTAGADEPRSGHKTAPLDDDDGLLSGHGTDPLLENVPEGHPEPLSAHGSAIRLGDPMDMMTGPSSGSGFTMLSAHGSFSIHLPGPQKVSRVEFGRDEHGDLIVILHE